MKNPLHLTELNQQELISINGGSAAVGAAGVAVGVFAAWNGGVVIGSAISAGITTGIYGGSFGSNFQDAIEANTVLFTSL